MEELIKIYEDNVLIEVIDTRTVAGQKAARIQQIKDAAKAEILDKYPEYKQRNALLGLLSDAEIEEIKVGIQDIRTQASDKENLINSCQSLQELDSLYL